VRNAAPHDHPMITSGWGGRLAALTHPGPRCSAAAIRTGLRASWQHAKPVRPASLQVAAVASWADVKVPAQSHRRP
jgi:hypothetical protein